MPKSFKLGNSFVMFLGKVVDLIVFFFIINLFKYKYFYLTEFQNIYNKLDIKLVERGESFYQQKMEDLVKDLEERGFLEEDEGRKIMWGENKQGIPLTVIKRDGGFTYDTSDMAAIKHRVVEEGAEWVSRGPLLNNNYFQPLNIQTGFYFLGNIRCGCRTGRSFPNHRKLC